MIYKLAKDSISGQIVSIIKTDDDGKVYGIPCDEGNTDYQAFLKYQEEGGKVYGADEEVPVNG